jgi:hypothetical protein
VICSLNEIEALARKAARGGGMSWGLAEEAGKAVRWLSDNGFPGPWLLSELLLQNDGKPYSELALQQGDDGISRARNGLLCPIIAGALICDQADDLKDGTQLRLGNVAVPLLLAPFACEAARSAGVSVALEWRGVTISLEEGAPRVEGEEAALLVAETGIVALSRTIRQANGAVRTYPDRDVTGETMQALESYAQRTYAPATAESRAGAGAGQEGD